MPLAAPQKPCPPDMSSDEKRTVHRDAVLELAGVEIMMLVFRPRPSDFNLTASLCTRLRADEELHRQNRLPQTS
eukprot:2355916-Rhodomonas_salina.3